MIINSVDYIVRNNLLRHGYPLHWYMQSLVYAVECLSELAMDDLKIINSQLIPVNDYNAIDLPTDFLDIVQVGLKVGQHVKPMIEDNSINSLRNYDSDFNIIKYNETEQTTDDQSVVLMGNLPNWWYGFTPVNSYGEQTGRAFGFGNGSVATTYKLVKERNQIQLNENLEVDDIVLQYISDGRNADAASCIESYALGTIRAYIDYRLKDFNRSYSRGEVEQAKQDYFNERKRLRGRKSDLTLVALRNIIYKNTKLSPK